MSNQVGSGHVSIFPVLTGFKSRVAKETRDAGARGAKTFEGGFKGAGTRAGRVLGRDMKQALTSSAGDVGAAALRKLNGEVASASAALSKARLRQQDEAGRVRVAETRLREAIERSGEGSSQAVAAEERLESARRRQQTVTDAVTSATTRLKAAQDAAAEAARQIATQTTVSAGGLRLWAQNLHAGWTEARAATSAFTGLTGSVAGILRAVSDVSGLSALGRLARLGAQRASKAFTSLATMVGGGLAKAWTRTRSWLGGIAATVRGAFGPMAQYVAAAATLAFSPFRRLGSSVATWMRPVTTQVSGLFSKLVPAAARGATGMASVFGRGLSRLGGIASSAFSSMAGAARAAGSRVGSALASGVRSTATAGVTAVAAGIGVAFGKGVGRLTAIDTAQAKLRGLGNDAGTVKAIMDDANASVKGTAFGLGEAATTAAGAVAAGIKPGEQLQGVLKGVANVAAASGRTMTDTGAIFNKVAAGGKAYTEDIKQIADSGLPMWQKLSEELGVTTDEVQKMASEGKIDFETFSRAAAAAAGTVADEMGKTVPGAAKNFFAAMGRIGAKALGGLEEGSFYSKLGPLINSVTKALGPLETKAEALGQAWNSWVGPIMDRLTGFFNGIADGSSNAVSKLKEFSPILAPLGGAFAALGAGGLAGLMTRLPLVGGMLGGLAGPLAMLGGPLGVAAAALAAFFATGGDADALASGITDIIGKITAALPGVIDAITAAVPGIIDGILAALPQLLSAAVRIVQALVLGLVTAVPQLVDGALALVDGLVAGLVANLPMIILAAIKLVMTLIQGIILALPMLVSGAVQLVSGLLGAIVTLLPVIIQGGIQLLMALIGGIIAALPMLLDAALQLVRGLLGALIDNLPMIIQAGIQLLLSLVTGLLGALPDLIVAAVQLVLQLVAGLITMLPQLIEAGVTLVIALIQGLLSAIPQILEMLPQIVSAIWDGLADIDWAQLGKDIVQGLIDGLGSMIGNLGDMIGNLASSAWEGFTSFFGIKSPSRLMRGAGVNLVEGAVGGVEDEGPKFGDSLVAMAKKASGKAQKAMGAVSVTVSEAATEARSGHHRPGGPGDGPAAVGAPTFIQNNHIAHLDPEVAIEATGQRMTAAARRVGV